MDPNELVAIYKAGGWVPLTAAIGGALVRLMKSDTKLPINLPAAWRPYAAMAITIALAVLQHRFAATGGTWGQAVGFGVVAGMMAILGHVGGVEWLRDGKEIPVPGLMKTDKKPPSAPPLPLFLLLLALAFVGASGCTPAKGAEDIVRDIARGSVLVAVEAVDIADVVCANIVATAKGSEDEDTLRKGIDLGHRCARAKDAALIAAKSASLAIKAWGSATAGKLACAAVQILDGLNLVRDAAVRFGQPIPVEIEDGISSAARLARFLPSGASCDLKAAP